MSLSYVNAWREPRLYPGDFSATDSVIVKFVKMTTRFSLSPVATHIPEPSTGHSQDGSTQQTDAPIAPAPDTDVEVEDAACCILLGVLHILNPFVVSIHLEHSLSNSRPDRFSFKL